jgi:hypothetical protein
MAFAYFTFRAVTVPVKEKYYTDPISKKSINQ